jgi:hypothetical protein
VIHNKVPALYRQATLINQIILSSEESKESYFGPALYEAALQIKQLGLKVLQNINAPKRWAEEQRDVWHPSSKQDHQ